MSRTDDLFLSPRLPRGPVPHEVLADLLAGEPPVPPETTPRELARILDATDRQVLYAIAQAGVEPEERKGTAPVLDRRHQLDVLDVLAQIGRRPRGDAALADRAERLRSRLQIHFAIESARTAARLAVEFRAAQVLGLHRLSLRDAVEHELREYRKILPPQLLATVADEVAP